MCKKKVMSRIVTGRGVEQVKHGWLLLKNRKVMWQMIRETLKGSYRMSLLSLAVSVCSIAYIIFPFDLIPDYIPVLGWIDDGVVFYLMLKRLSWETQRYNRYKAAERRSV